MAKTKEIRQKEQTYRIPRSPNHSRKGLAMKKHLLSLADLGTINLSYLVDRSTEFAGGQVDSQKLLAGKVIGTYFSKPSTRTRSSFTVGALRLGAQIVAYGPNDLQLTTGEAIKDT